MKISLTSEDDIANIDISTDGTWQRRGYSPLNGVVTVVRTTESALHFKHLQRFASSVAQVTDSMAYLDHADDRNGEYLNIHDCTITIVVQQDQ